MACHALVDGILSDLRQREEIRRMLASFRAQLTISSVMGIVGCAHMGATIFVHTACDVSAQSWILSIRRQSTVARYKLPVTLSLS